MSMILETASALLGIGGTWLMSRKYTTSLLTFLVFALLSPVMFVLGQGKRVHAYYQGRMLANPDVPIANSRMAVGLGLLCWAFFLQLLLLFV